MKTVWKVLRCVLSFVLYLLKAGAEKEASKSDKEKKKDPESEL